MLVLKIAFNLLIFLSLWASNGSVAVATDSHTIGAPCGKKNAILPPDFVKVHEKLIRTLSNGDNSYFDRLLAPGIVSWEQSYIEELSVVEEAWEAVQSRELVQHLLHPTSRCTRVQHGIRCRSYEYATEDTFVFWSELPVAVKNVEGAYVRKAPSEDSEIASFLPCGMTIYAPRTSKEKGTEWFPYRYAPSYERGYVRVNDLEIHNRLQSSWVTFRKIAGIWRITDFHRSYIIP